MKIKMFKKIIAALCAATTSTSIVVPTGAINYTVMSDNLPEDQKNALEKLGDKIRKGQENLQKIQELFSNNNKKEDANLISSVINNFQKLDNKSIPNDLEFAKYLHSEVININRLISLMTMRIRRGENVNVEGITNDINLKIQKLLDKIDEKINKEKQEKEKLEREKRKLKFETMSKALREKQHLYLRLKNSNKIDTKKVDTESIVAKVDSCCDLEEKAKESLSEEILEKYIKESNELISMIDLATAEYETAEKERLEREKRKLKFEKTHKALKTRKMLFVKLRKSTKIDANRVDFKSISDKIKSCFSLEEKAKELLSEEILQKYIEESNELISTINLAAKVEKPNNKEQQEKERLEREKRKSEFETMSKAWRRKQDLFLKLKNSNKIDANMVDCKSISEKIEACHILEEETKEWLSDEILQEYSEGILQRYIEESNELISMIDLAENVEKLNRKFKNFKKFTLYRNAGDEFDSIQQDFGSKYYGLKFCKANMMDRIKLVDDTSKSLDKFRYTRGLTVVKKGELSGLRREAGIKVDELIILRDLAKKKDATLYDTLKDISNDAIKSYNECDKTNKEDLEKVIVKLSNAISQFQWADNNEQDPVLKWQTQAHQNINSLMIDAEKEMENGLNKETTIEDLKKEFNPLLCGTQHFGNCWLYAICNVHNILKHLEGKDDIIQNKGKRDGDNFDEVENFFKNHAKLSNKVISKGGNVDDESNVLSKLGINHTSVNLEHESKDEKSLEKNVNIVKTLLLKHFAKSKAPVLIGVKNIWVPFDSKDRADGNHAMVVVGLDIKSNEVTVADSNEEKIEVYDLDDLAYFICKTGKTDFIRKKISMIFTSLNNKEDFNYDNSNNTWDEFESKLLPAISK